MDLRLKLAAEIRVKRGFDGAIGVLPSAFSRAIRPRLTAALAAFGWRVVKSPPMTMRLSVWMTMARTGPLAFGLNDSSRLPSG
jgi:hypothetical protein